MPQQRERTTVASQGSELAVVVDRPESEPSGWALFCHCFTCSKDLPIYHHVAKTLNAEGLGVVRFDLPGLGNSGGDFSQTTFTTHVQNALDIAAWMTERSWSPRLMVGHSFGGPTAVSATLQLPDTLAVATIGAPFAPAHVRHYCSGSRRVGDNLVEIDVAGRPIRLSLDFFYDIEQQEMRRRYESLRRPLLIFHSPVDAVVGIDQAALIYQAARQPKSFVSLDLADHIVSKERDARYLGHVLSAWANYYLTT